MKRILFPGILAVTLSATTAHAAIMTFNSTAAANNATTRSTWLAAAGITTPQFLVDFESGFTNNQNIHGVSLSGGLVLSDTLALASVLIKAGNGSIGGSNPVGGFAATHTDPRSFVLDFSANPVDYFAFQDIDHTSVRGVITYIGGTTSNFTLDGTISAGNSAEFFGVFRNDQPQIARVAMDAFGDGRWGIDNIEFGDVITTTLPAPGVLGLIGLGLLAFGATSVRRK